MHQVSLLYIFSEGSCDTEAWFKISENSILFNFTLDFIMNLLCVKTLVRKMLYETNPSVRFFFFLLILNLGMKLFLQGVF